MTGQQPEHCGLAPLFAGWQQTMVDSYLQGHMGAARTDGLCPPRSAAITVGDFCFFAGRPHAGLVQAAAAPILVPRTPAWHPVIEAVWGEGVAKALRYSILKEPGVFDPGWLRACAARLPAGYRLEAIGPALYAQALAQGWSADLCSQFAGPQDYQRRGVGVAALCQGRLVAGASSYTVYTGGIEIEIDTHPLHRREGLATACGAALILECLRRGLYPSWDAHDLRSAALAQKLGYHRGPAYQVYLRR